VIIDLCAECGADLRQSSMDGDIAGVSQASIAMIHSVPDLKVCPELAEKLGKKDEQHLLEDRKLVLLVDLDQTIVHTTNDNIPANLKVSEYDLMLDDKYCRWNIHNYYHEINKYHTSSSF